VCSEFHTFHCNRWEISDRTEGAKAACEGCGYLEGSQIARNWDRHDAAHDQQSLRKSVACDLPGDLPGSSPSTSGRRFDVISTGTALGRTVAFGPKRTSGECLGAGRSTSNSVKAPLPQPMSIHRKPERGPASRGRYRPRAGSSFPSSARRRPRRRNGFDVRPSGVFFRGQVRRAHIATTHPSVKRRSTR
jgi:hypothetical protein